MSEKSILRENTPSAAPDTAAPDKTADGTPPAAAAISAGAAVLDAPAAPVPPAAPATSAAPATPAAPAAPAAPTASRPERPARRVGTLTMGIALVFVGAALCAFQFSRDQNMLLLFCKFSPLLLVALGCEVLISAATAKGARLKYDFLSMFVCFFLLVGALAASCLPLVFEYAGPGRYSAETRVEQSIYNTLYEQLKDNGNISQIHVNASLTYNGGYDAVQTAADLKTGDRVYMTVEVRGECADKAAFVKACRPALDALRAQDLPYLIMNFRTVDPQNGAPQYMMDLSGRYQLEMSDADLVQYVSEQIYVEDAGYYMTAAEAAEWAGGRLEEERNRQQELDDLREQLDDLNARLAETEERAETAEVTAAAAQQASAAAEERAGQLQEENDRLYQQLNEVLQEG